jgi:hypothetical protein
LERRISGTGSGLWPTPVASDTGSRSKPYAQGGTPLSLAVKWPTPTARCHKGGGEFHDTQGWEKSFGHARLGGGVPNWWTSEPDVDRVVNGVAARVHRLKAIGNGQVPACAAAAWRLLTE